MSEAVFTRPPRPQLITMAPSFMLAMLQHCSRTSPSSVWQCKTIEHHSVGATGVDTRFLIESEMADHKPGSANAFCMLHETASVQDTLLVLNHLWCFVTALLGADQTCPRQ